MAESFFFSAPCGFGKTVLADALLRGRNVLRQSAADLDCAIPPSEQDWDILLIDNLQLMQEEAGQQALCELDSIKSGAPFCAALARGAARLPDGVSVHGADDGVGGRRSAFLTRAMCGDCFSFRE